MTPEERVELRARIKAELATLVAQARARLDETRSFQSDDELETLIAELEVLLSSSGH